MSRNISMSEIEEIIKGKIRDYGATNKVDQGKISEIKERIRNIIEKRLSLTEQGESEGQENNTSTATQPPSKENPIQQPGQQVVDAAPKATENPNITIKTTQDEKMAEVVNQKAELDAKEKELIEKESELKRREEEIRIKEEELRYKPGMPEFIRNIEPSSIIIFSENELSLGAESLSERKFRLSENPDVKESAHELWIKSGITKTEVYLAQPKKIGFLVFDPFQGKTNFSSEPIDVENQEPEQQVPEASQQGTIQSQIPGDGMLDSIDPIKNVSMPIVNPGIKPAESQIEEWGPEFQSMIEKIVKDELFKKSKPQD